MTDKDILAKAIVVNHCPITEYTKDCTSCSHFRGLKKVISNGVVYWLVQCKYEQKITDRKSVV